MNIVTSNHNNDIGQLYHICNPYKMSEGEYKLYETVGFLIYVR